MATLTQTRPQVRTELTLSDRCDRCGAAAQTQFVLPSGHDLLVCGHHDRKHRKALTDGGAQVAYSTAEQF